MGNFSVRGDFDLIFFFGMILTGILQAYGTKFGLWLFRECHHCGGLGKKAVPHGATDRVALAVMAFTFVQSGACTLLMRIA